MKKSVIVLAAVLALVPTAASATTFTEFVQHGVDSTGTVVELLETGTPADLESWADETITTLMGFDVEACYAQAWGHQLVSTAIIRDAAIAMQAGDELTAGAIIEEFLTWNEGFGALLETATTECLS